MTLREPRNRIDSKCKAKIIPHGTPPQPIGDLCEHLNKLHQVQQELQMKWTHWLNSQYLACCLNINMHVTIPKDLDTE